MASPGPMTISKAATLAAILAWDLGCGLANLVTPKRKEGSVTPHGHPGENGTWPEFVAPKEGDSRSPCPGLNAMANHGILPHDGKNITFAELNRTLRTTYNVSPSFCYHLPNYVAGMLGKRYGKDTFDLGDLNLHNGIEHDASLTREDTAVAPDQSKPHPPFILELLAEATGKDDAGRVLLTIEDLSRYSSKRRADARAENPEFTLSQAHKNFGSGNSSTLLTVMGGRVEDIEPFLLEERLVEGWESRIRQEFGLTLKVFNDYTKNVEKGISEERYLAAKNGVAGTEGSESGSTGK